MSTNLEYRARERRRKRECRRQASETRREKGRKRSRARNNKKKKTDKQTKKTKETFFVGTEQHENFVAAVTKWQMLAATNASWKWAAVKKSEREHVLGQVESLKRPPQVMQRSFLMTQRDPSKGFHKDMMRHLSKIVLENSSQASLDIPWTMTSQNLFSQTGQGCFNCFNFSLKILVLKLSAKVSGLSISLATWIKAFSLLRVIKVSL